MKKSNTSITIVKEIENGVEKTEVTVMVKGEKQNISDNLYNVLIREKRLSQILSKRIPKGENVYVIKRPKGYYKVLAKEVGRENLLSALKELRKLSINLPDLGVNIFQQLKLALMD